VYAAHHVVDDGTHGDRLVHRVDTGIVLRQLTDERNLLVDLLLTQVTDVEVLGVEIGGPFQRGRGGPGWWWILFEPELQLTELEPIAPDLAGWRVERMPSLPDTAYFSIVPDWVCEVLSKSTESMDRNQKLPLYAANGVQHVWLVDPIAKTLEAHAHPESGRWQEVRVYQRDAPLRVAPFEAIALELAALAPTMGDLYTEVLYPAISSHRRMPAEERARLGISDGFVRISVGIEDVADILGELDHALKRV
jgi:hypothetical protein